MATTITPTIVNVNTTVQASPTVSQLQQSVAIISTGGTTLATGSYQYEGQLSGVTAILAAPLAISTISWLSSVATVTTVGTLQQAVGQTFTVTIAGAVPAAYNGTYLATVTGTDIFTYALSANPGVETTPGTYTPGNSAAVNNAATTFFAQGSSVGVYVLELGPQTTDAVAITALQTWLTANASPQPFYAYLTPNTWDTQAAAVNTLAANYESPSGQTYFVVTASSGNVTLYAANKAVLTVTPSPTAASTEFQAAAVLYNIAVNNPGLANKLAPMQYRYLYGVTPWVQKGNSVTINTVLTGDGNLIMTGAEGGISTAALYKGTTMDGTQFSNWYGIDWFRVQVKQALAAAIINGSNGQPPLLYDQSGINTLLAIAQQVGNSAVSFGCAQSVTVTAVPFYTYTQANPTNYNSGIYNGLSATLVGQNGFLTVTFNLTAQQFAV